MPTFEKRSPMPVPAGELDRWHASPGAFERLSPPWMRIAVVHDPGSIADGARRVLSIGRPPFARRWVAVHRDRRPGTGFTDVQESGPFARWVHEHRFDEAGAGESALTDRVSYELPFGAAGAIFEGPVRRKIERTFSHRHAITRADLERHAPYVGAPPLRVAITGSSGLVGRALTAFLGALGHEVVRIPRGASDPATLDGADAVVHLAGAPIASGRWTAARMAAIRDSRVEGTARLAQTLAGLARKPRVLVSASAIGYYGLAGEATLDESSPAGEGFLAEVCRGWEGAVASAERAGIRTVRTRFGIVLTPKGGALAKLLPVFRAGLGGPIGGGRQGFSWVALDDVLYAIHHVIRNEAIAGAVNVAAPHPLSQREFATELGRVLRRPAVMPLPAAAVRALFGRMGEEALLAGQYVSSRKLTASGFRFTYTSLAAIEGQLG